MARRGRAIAEPTARWALKIDSTIAVQRCELKTRAYAHDTLRFALTPYAITQSLRCAILGHIYSCIVY